MTAILIRLGVNTIALLCIPYIITGVSVRDWYAALITAVVLGFLNAVIRPILILLTLPITIITIGLFTLCINGFLFWFVGTVVKGFSVSGFWPAFFGALFMSLVGSLTSLFLYKK